MKAPYRILLADDHPIIRQGIQRIIEEKAGLKVIGGVADGYELLKSVRELGPDMVIVDLSMPRLDGIQAVRQIKANHPLVKVLILTMYKEEGYLSEAISAGADGYLVKEDADIELYDAIETIRSGRHYITSALSRAVTDAFVRMSRGDVAKASDKDLTAREIEILKLIADGKSGKEIAERLFISARTVGNHRANIMKKLGLKKNIELVRFAIRKGYIPAIEGR